MLKKQSLREDYDDGLLALVAAVESECRDTSIDKQFNRSSSQDKRSLYGHTMAQAKYTYLLKELQRRQIKK